MSSRVVGNNRNSVPLLESIRLDSLFMICLACTLTWSAMWSLSSNGINITESIVLQPIYQILIHQRLVRARKT